MEEGENLTLGEDRMTLLITEVYIFFLSMSPAIDSPFYSKFSSFVLHNSSSHSQALQEICLASHIRSMADPLHADIIQQLEVALLGSPAAQVIDLLSGGWVQTKPVPTSIHPHSQVYTSTPPAPASNISSCARCF